MKISSIISGFKEASISDKNADLRENSYDHSDKIDRKFLELFDSASNESSFDEFIL